MAQYCDNFYFRDSDNDSFEFWNGLRGPAGPQGPAGADGTDGSNGVTFTPAVSSAGVISWTNDGSLPNPDPVDIKGPQGPAGAAGSDGSNGVTFTPAVSSAGVISWTNNGGLPNPSPVDIRGPQGPQGEPQTPSDATPLMDGAASAGISTEYARGDHRHPSDYNKAPVITDTASGAVASFPDGADGMPLKSLTVNIEPVQTGSGDPSPENVRPISGWMGAKVANISDSEKQPYFAGLLNGTYGFVDLGTLDWTYSAGAVRFDAEQAIATPASNTAFISAKYIIKNVSEGWSSEDKVISLFVKRNAVYAKDSSYTDAATFKAAMSGVYLVYELDTPTTPTITQAQYNILLQSFSLGGWLVPISWQSEAGTVYGGTLDATAGTMTVDRAMLTLDGTQNIQIENWRPRANSVGWIYPYTISGNYIYSDLTMMQDIVSDQLSPVAYNDIYTNDIPSVSTVVYSGPPYALGLVVRMTDTTLTTKAAINAYLAQHPITVCYRLATPIEIALSPTQIDTLLGTNNIWADCGDVSVDYPADTKLYIQKVNKPTDDDMTADSQIASGKYFIIGNSLYLSTTTIPAGDTIIPGTNCQKTDLAAALNALNT